MFNKEISYITDDNKVVHGVIINKLIGEKTLFCLMLHGKNIKEVSIPEDLKIDWLCIYSNPNLLNMVLPLGIDVIFVDHHVNIINLDELVKTNSKIEYEHPNFNLWN